MIQRLSSGFRRTALVMAVAISSGICAITPASAQSPQMEQKLMAIKEAQAANKQKLAQYTWTETETIAIKGDVKDTKTYQVQMVNGQQQKTLVNDQKASSGGGREGRVKERIIEKKTEEYQEYGQSIGALAKQYTTAQSRSLDAGQAGRQYLVATRCWHREPGDQELREAGRLNDHDHQRADTFADERAGELVPERSQGRRYHLRAVRAATGRHQPRRDNNH